MLKEADLSCEVDETCAPASLWMRNVQQGIFAIPQAAYLLWLYLLWSKAPSPCCRLPRCTTYCDYTYCGYTYSNALQHDLGRASRSGVLQVLDDY